MDPPSRRPNKHRYSAIPAVVEPSYPRWMRRSISPTRPTDPLVRGCAIINSPCRSMAMATIEAWVAPAAKSSLVRQKVELEPLGDEEVEVEVEHCGLCHSDLSIRNNDWGFSRFPAVLGHEAVGRVVEVGRAAKGLTVGQRVGVGWTAGSCMHCLNACRAIIICARKQRLRSSGTRAHSPAASARTGAGPSPCRKESTSPRLARSCAAA